MSVELGLGWQFEPLIEFSFMQFCLVQQIWSIGIRKPELEGLKIRERNIINLNKKKKKNCGNRN